MLLTNAWIWWGAPVNIFDYQSVYVGCYFALGWKTWKTTLRKIHFKNTAKISIIYNIDAVFLNVKQYINENQS